MFRKRWIIERPYPSGDEGDALANWEPIGTVIGPKDAEAAIRAVREIRSPYSRAQGTELRAIDWGRATAEQRQAAEYEDRMLDDAMRAESFDREMIGQMKAMSAAMKEGGTQPMRAVHDRTARRGWAMGLLVMIGVIWLLRQGLPPMFLLVEGGLTFTSGYWVGRLTYWRGYAAEHLGLEGVTYAKRFAGLLFGWTGLGVATVLRTSISETWRHGVALIVFWWAGVAVATYADVRGQQRFEKFLESLPPSKLSAAQTAARDYVTDPSFSVRRLYPKLISAVAQRLART